MKAKLIILIFSMGIGTVIFKRFYYRTKLESRLPTSLTESADPFALEAWHLKNTGQNAFSISPGIEGMDLHLSETYAQGLSGRGIHILISDDGVESGHEDLAANYDGTKSKNYMHEYPFLWDANDSIDSPPDEKFYHGTAVAGLVAGVKGNGRGSHGVAYKAIISSNNYTFPYNGGSVSFLLDQADASNGIDIFNYSYGGSFTKFDPSINDSGYRDFADAIKKGATSKGRNGLGAVYIRSAGNSFKLQIPYGENSFLTRAANSNLNFMNTIPYVIVVGAFDAQGKATSYSNMGSCLWISAPGGEDGKAFPAMITIDRTGCDDNMGKSIFDSGEEGNDNCNYTSSMNGTSSAAPLISGVVALMLEANPKLTPRDIKYILAKTADHDFTISANDRIKFCNYYLLFSEPEIEAYTPAISYHDNQLFESIWDKNNNKVNTIKLSAGEINMEFLNWLAQNLGKLEMCDKLTSIGARGSKNAPNGVPNPPGYSWWQDWSINKAGYYFSNDYGFGRVHADKAVAMALNHYNPLPPETVTNKIVCLKNKSLEIPDFDAEGVTLSCVLDKKNNSAIKKIEEVLITLHISHPHTGDIGIELISPSGTKSILLNANNSLYDNANINGEVLLSNAFYGEAPTGKWKLKVIDGGEGERGILKGWELQIHGH